MRSLLTNHHSRPRSTMATLTSLGSNSSLNTSFQSDADAWVDPESVKKPPVGPSGLANLVESTALPPDSQDCSAETEGIDLTSEADVKDDVAVLHTVDHLTSLAAQVNSRAHLVCAHVRTNGCLDL